LDRLHLITVFVAVVDSNGLAGAARKLSISPSAVTRAINELETALGVRLLTRTTRVVRVTEAGARYAEDCRRILGELAEAAEMHGDDVDAFAAFLDDFGDDIFKRHRDKFHARGCAVSPIAHRASSSAGHSCVSMDSSGHRVARCVVVLRHQSSPSGG